MRNPAENISSARSKTMCGGTTSDGPRPESPTHGVAGETRADRGEYAPIRDFDFGQALRYLKGGKMLARAGWNGKGQFLQLQEPDKGSKMTLPYIYIRTVQGDLVPWLASQTDLLASDWCLVAERTMLEYAGSPLVVEKRFGEQYARI